MRRGEGPHGRSTLRRDRAPAAPGAGRSRQPGPSRAPAHATDRRREETRPMTAEACPDMVAASPTAYRGDHGGCRGATGGERRRESALTDEPVEDDLRGLPPAAVD